MMQPLSNNSLEIVAMLEELGVEAIRIDLPFRLNHVNCFMAENEQGWTVIDTGLNNNETRAFWERKLKTKKVTDILVTHYHPDHFGYAGGLQEKTDAKVWITETDAKAGMAAWADPFLESIPGNYRASGIPEAQASQMVKNTAEFKSLVSPLPKVEQYLSEGDFIQIGRFEYRVISTPGHSDGMICFYNEERKTLFSADHILPKITPNISYWFHGNPDPLGLYLNSLKNVRKLDIEFVIPSHGNPFFGATQRIDELLAHHDERLEETLQAVTKPLSIFETCESLFSRPLTVHEMRFAVGETLAHLEYLRHKKECTREMENGIWFYEKI
ncbi:MBL fold metallo-hydrolase [Planococcus sp. CPCC 101016]|uniref:MBL fold metallo-hydrolase n=1 Tax=Planococcus sp. CPCC 101016 TaxID=2599617 RepID=UPI0011B6E588|nr:MBL fold metallo-hydrolase [Planococcus sp. CPCC 101016]TWT04298.1 MBL fold metallo-hydrolase [Planococcus sp. CPCC 101016]